MKKEEKWIHYASLLTAQIGSMFDEDSEYHISEEELGEDNNLTHFIHALTNVMPNHFYNSTTDSNLNSLDFNHISNKLVFQFSKK